MWGREPILEVVFIAPLNCFAVVCGLMLRVNWSHWNICPTIPFSCTFMGLLSASHDPGPSLLCSKTQGTAAAWRESTLARETVPFGCTRALLLVTKGLANERGVGKCSESLSRTSCCTHCIMLTQIYGVSQKEERNIQPEQNEETGTQKNEERLRKLQDKFKCSNSRIIGARRRGGRAKSGKLI